MSKESTLPNGTDKKLIFLVEDNEVYARSLQTFILVNFEKIQEIKIFPIGEMCVMDLERNPHIVIIDYFLNSKYAEANNGLEIIKRIKLLKPNTHIIVLSSQENLEVVSETIKLYDCFYIPKDPDAFNKVRLSIIKILGNEILPIIDPSN